MSKITSQINKYSDEVLCALAAGGCQDAEEELVKRYFRQVRICARPYFLAGGDSEDLIQEAMFGLLKAIREFEPSRDVQFRTFAEVCIRNQIRSAVTSAARSKHAPLNDSVPFEAPMVLRSEISPEELYISREEENERLARLGRQLSVLERICEVMSLTLPVKRETEDSWVRNPWDRFMVFWETWSAWPVTRLETDAIFRVSRSSLERMVFRLTARTWKSPI